MKKQFVITIDTTTQELSIKSPDGEVKPTGFILFCGNDQQVWTLHYGAYKPMVKDFYGALADPHFKGFAEELKRVRMQTITEEEALRKFEADCDCSGDGGCFCGNKKFH